MSIFSRISADLGEVKKLASIAHLGNGISIDAAKSLISKQLSAAAGGLTSQIAGATSGITSSIASATSAATKLAGTATKLAASASKITGANLTSGVLPGPIKR
jgi:hypothetical protein